MKRRAAMQPLSQFRKDMRVAVLCQYDDTKAPVAIDAKLGDEFERDYYYRSDGRFRSFFMDLSAITRVFELMELIECPHCKKKFDSVVIVSQGQKKNPIIFGEKKRNVVPTVCRRHKYEWDHKGNESCIKCGKTRHRRQEFSWI